MNFRDLEYVIKASECLSFNKAAKLCNVSQPSLSTQVKKLEKELGTDIFYRNKKYLSLTDYGKIFVESAKKILSIRGDLKQLAVASQNSSAGDLRLGAILTIAPYMFPQIVNTLAQQAPEIKLHLQEAKTEELLKGLLDNKIDAAIISLPSDQTVFDSHSLFVEPFYLAVAKDNFLASLNTISANNLKEQDLILLEEGHCFRSQALDVCYSISAKENTMFNATSLETIRKFVSMGEGITLMPKMAIQRNDGIEYIPMQDKSFNREIGIIWRKSCPKKALITKFISLIENKLFS